MPFGACGSWGVCLPPLESRIKLEEPFTGTDQETLSTGEPIESSGVLLSVAGQRVADQVRKATPELV
jgi:hypothetical protein